MIQYKIVSNSSTSKTKPSRSVSPGDANFQELVLERALRGCSYRSGDRIKLRGTSFRGKVINVIKEYSLISWDKGKRPLFVQILMDDGRELQVHPNQIKRSKI